jgi:uncharacterized membrane protein
VSGGVESLLARVLNAGTWVASAIIAVGLALPLLWAEAASGLGVRIVTGGIAMFILLPTLRVVLMFVYFVKARDYWFGAAAAVVLAIIVAGIAVGTLTG